MSNRACGPSDSEPTTKAALVALAVSDLGHGEILEAGGLQGRYPISGRGIDRVLCPLWAPSVEAMSPDSPYFENVDDLTSKHMISPGARGCRPPGLRSLP